jgi:cysteinyl-tRNA synthetase
VDEPGEHAGIVGSTGANDKFASEAHLLECAPVPIRIFETMARDKIEFRPLEPGKVRMYVCGPTPYAPSHIGHARTFIAFDVVARWLRRSYEVTYVRNVTDVDDKIIKAANAAGVPAEAFAGRYLDEFHRDMAAVGCASPDVEPRVTTHMAEIIALVSDLVQRGFAYPVDGDVYFDVLRFPAYGALSQQTLEERDAGARVEVDPRKRSPYDFALWKAAKPGEPFWASPWGQGRPGWHIECSAMSKKHLGATFDVHGGGKDLMFPHHENEIAQSCAASGEPVLARYWMHSGFVNLMPEKCPRCNTEMVAEAKACAACGHVLTDDDLKMSKSRGNFYPIHETISAFEPEALRMLLLSSQYRSPIAFSHTLLAEAERRLDKLYETVDGIRRATSGAAAIASGPGLLDSGLLKVDPRKAFAEAMDDDFNTAIAIAELAAVFRAANELLHETAPKKGAERVRLLREAGALIAELGGVLALFQQDPAAYLARRRDKRARALQIEPAEIERLIGERAAARKAKDYKRGDEIRDQLKAKQIVLKDGKDGTSWEIAEP